MGPFLQAVLSCNIFRAFGHPPAHSVNGQDCNLIEAVYLMIIVKLMGPHFLFFHICKKQLEHILLENTEILLA